MRPMKIMNIANLSEECDMIAYVGGFQSKGAF